MSKKITKKKTVAGSVAAVFVAATLALFGINDKSAIEVNYELIKGENATELVIYPPESVGVDILELYCNDSLVTKTLLPQGTLKSIPIVFSDLSNLELRLCKCGEVVGVGNFNEGKLYVAFKDGVIENEK